MWFPAEFGKPAPLFFARKKLLGKVEQTGLRTPVAGRLPTI
jgi:hypothetical protein